MNSITIAWSSRILTAALMLSTACTDRALEDGASEGSTTLAAETADPSEHPEADTIARRCAWIVDCQFGWDERAECERDHAARLAGYRADDTASLDCVPATLDFWACGNEATDCREFWFSWGLLEHNERCGDAKERVCEARCGGCASDT